jgi:hypothetical protein
MTTKASRRAFGMLQHGDDLEAIRMATGISVEQLKQMRKTMWQEYNRQYPEQNKIEF